jgi:hypothetical protein
MAHGPSHGTQGDAVSDDALLFLVGLSNLHGAGGCEIDDGSDLGGAGDVHHDAVAAPRLALHHTERRRM